MTTPEFELFLARLYTDGDLLERFLANPGRAVEGAGLTAEQVDELRRIDREGLVLACRGFAVKRAYRRRPAPSWVARIRRWLGA